MKFKKIKTALQNRLCPHPGEGYAVFQYTFLKDDGTFDYEQYKRIQTEGNKRKIDRVSVREIDIQFLSRYIKKHIPNPEFGVCHGSRRGLEQKWFKQNLGCKVVGTEISDTAAEFEDTIQWDFHEEKPEWDARADFVYSNSLDHAYDPGKALRAWMKSLKPSGVCIIEHTKAQTVEKSRPLDPFGAALEIMPYLVLRWSGGAFSVREILDGPPPRDGEWPRSFLIVRKN